MKQKTLPPTRNQRRPSKSVLAPLGGKVRIERKRGEGERSGNVPDHEADGDGEGPSRNEPDCICRVSETRGDLRLDGGHDRNGPEG
jgi:hypothetical protein